MAAPAKTVLVTRAAITSGAMSWTAKPAGDSGVYTVDARPLVKAEGLSVLAFFVSPQPPDSTLFVATNSQQDGLLVLTVAGGGDAPLHRLQFALVDAGGHVELFSVSLPVPMSASCVSPSIAALTTQRGIRGPAGPTGAPGPTGSTGPAGKAGGFDPASLLPLPNGLAADDLALIYRPKVGVFTIEVSDLGGNATLVSFSGQQATFGGQTILFGTAPAFSPPATGFAGQALGFGGQAVTFSGGAQTIAFSSSGSTSYAGQPTTYNGAAVGGAAAGAVTAGPVGATGAQGPPGATGATGSQGLQGLPGVAGATGAASTVPGPAGVAGPTGATGLQGIAGPAGVAGPQGTASTALGPAGQIGATGLQGLQGVAGPAGAVGPQGAASTVPGPAGPTGATGLQGLQGVVGAQGVTGATGQAGAQGPAGTFNLPVSNVYTQSGAISVTDKLAVVNSTSTAAMTLVNGTVDGAQVTIKRYGAGVVTVAAVVDGSQQTVTMSNSTLKESITLTWSVPLISYVMI